MQEETSNVGTEVSVVVRHVEWVEVAFGFDSYQSLRMSTNDKEVVIKADDKEVEDCAIIMMMTTMIITAMTITTVMDFVMVYLQRALVSFCFFSFLAFCFTKAIHKKLDAN